MGPTSTPINGIDFSGSGPQVDILFKVSTGTYPWEQTHTTLITTESDSDKCMEYSTVTVTGSY